MNFLYLMQYFHYLIFMKILYSILDINTTDNRSWNLKKNKLMKKNQKGKEIKWKIK